MYYILTIHPSAAKLVDSDVVEIVICIPNKQLWCQDESLLILSFFVKAQHVNHCYNLLGKSPQYQWCCGFY